MPKMLIDHRATVGHETELFTEIVTLVLLSCCALTQISRTITFGHEHQC